MRLRIRYTNKRFSVNLSPTRLNWILWRRKDSDKMLFLLQWNMPELQHFIINEK